MEALNVKNAQPGMHYYYERAKPSDVQRRLNEGWEPVTSSDPEQWGAELPEDVQRQLDGVKAFGDVMLFKISTDRYRLLQDQWIQEAKDRRDGPEVSYQTKGEERAGELGAAAPEGDLYYQRPNHRRSYSE
jgi:hypothetical protein